MTLHAHIGANDAAATPHVLLKAKQRALRDGFPENFGLRIHRALSWLGRAEAEADDPDARFVFLWIAFNAAYARDIDVPGERVRWTEFFRRLDRLDDDRRIYGAIWTRFSGPIRLLLQNRHVSPAFWRHHDAGDPRDVLRAGLYREARGFRTALQSGDTAAVLVRLFDHLYVLRNQLMHGGATWASRVNRDQVRDGAVECPH